MGPPAARMLLRWTKKPASRRVRRPLTDPGMGERGRTAGQSGGRRHGEWVPNYTGEWRQFLGEDVHHVTD